MAKYYIETHFPVEVDPYKYHPNNGFLTHNGRVFMPISGRQYASCLAFLKEKELQFQISTAKIDDVGIAELLGVPDPAHPGRAYDPKTGKMYYARPPKEVSQ